MVTNKIAKIGHPCPDYVPEAYIVDVGEHIPFVDPAKFGLAIEAFQARDYFVTSGDAVEKTKVLEKDIWRYAGLIQKLLHQAIATEHGCTAAKAHVLKRDKKIKKPALLKFCEYEALVWKSAGNARRLLRLLLEAKGTNIFLETEWQDHVLYAIPKNPRIKDKEEGEES